MRRLRAPAAAALVAAVLAGWALPVAAAAAPGGHSVFADENIVKAAVARISARRFQDVHVNVACFQSRLLLTGEVPNDGERLAVQQVVADIPNMQSIDNELVVGPVIGISVRTTDSWTTSDVKFRLLKGGFGRDEVGVVTENGTVYLMGRLSRKQGAAAANIASTTNRVQRVVLVFQYTD